VACSWFSTIVLRCDSALVVLATQGAAIPVLLVGVVAAFAFRPPALARQ
jgi:hypothetical protein